jgi:hypothetical protein
VLNFTYSIDSYYILRTVIKATSIPSEDNLFFDICDGGD